MLLVSSVNSREIGMGIRDLYGRLGGILIGEPDIPISLQSRDSCTLRPNLNPVRSLPTSPWQKLILLGMGTLLLAACALPIASPSSVEVANTPTSTPTVLYLDDCGPDDFADSGYARLDCYQPVVPGGELDQGALISCLDGNSYGLVPSPSGLHLGKATLVDECQYRTIEDGSGPDFGMGYLDEGRTLYAPLGGEGPMIQPKPPPTDTATPIPTNTATPIPTNTATPTPEIVTEDSLSRAFPGYTIVDCGDCGYPDDIREALREAGHNPFLGEEIIRVGDDGIKYHGYGVDGSQVIVAGPYLAIPPVGGGGGGGGPTLRIDCPADAGGNMPLYCPDAVPVVIRQGPGPNDTIIYRVTSADDIQVLGSVGLWRTAERFQVLTPDGEVGYIAGEPLLAPRVGGPYGWDLDNPEILAILALATPTPVPPTATSTPAPTPIPWASIDLPDGTPKDQADYALSLLDQNGYGDLATQLRQLPEITDGIDDADVEALADITALAVNATDTEVREAYDLMVRGGRGSDLVSYGPWWNTQLQVLYQLAQQNEFRDNDTLAQAIAMSNGLWLAMGNDEVDQAVREDVNAFLDFQRQYNPQVEDYPLEALAALAWMGNYSASGGRVFPLRNYSGQLIPLEAYRWNTVDIDTLRNMREVANNNGWVGADSGETIGNIEHYFYFDRGPQGGNSSHWEYASDANGHAIIDVDGRRVANHDLNNVGFIWKYYSETNKGIGECGDNSILVEAIGKSLGIPGTEVIRQATDTQRVLDSHMFPLYFSEDGSWKAYDKELDVGRGMTHDYTLYVARPPINHNGYLDYWFPDQYCVKWLGGMYYVPDRTFKINEIKNMFLEGIPIGTIG